MNKGIIIIILLIITVGAIIWFVFNNQEKDICGPKQIGPGYDMSYCDQSCNFDDDCKYACGCGAINKDEVCGDEGIMWDCVNHEVSCQDNKCVEGEEEVISQKVIDICKEEKEIECDPNCVDGSNEYCYFDSGTYNKNEYEGDFSLSEEIKEVCFAIHSSSVCVSCINKFEIKESDKFEEVSCEQFFQVIENKNKSCNDCVDVIWAGCC